MRAPARRVAAGFFWRGADLCARRTGAGKDELDLVARRAQEHWDSLSTKEKIRDVAARHEYGIIGGAWATTMVGSFGWIMRDK